MSINYYRELARKFHPDTNKGNKSCAVIFKVVCNLNKANKQTELKNLYNRLHTGFISRWYEQN